MQLGQAGGRQRMRLNRSRQQLKLEVASLPGCATLSKSIGAGSQLQWWLIRTAAEDMALCKDGS